GVGVHLAIDFQLGSTLGNNLPCKCHFFGRLGDTAAKVGVREQGNLGNHAKAANLCCSLDGHVGNLFGAGVFVNVGVADEQGVLGQHQHVHGGVGLGAITQTDNFIDVSQLIVVTTANAAQHGIGVAALQQHDADQRVVFAHHGFGDFGCDAVTALQLVV